MVTMQEDPEEVERRKREERDFESLAASFETAHQRVEEERELERQKIEQLTESLQQAFQDALSEVDGEKLKVIGQELIGAAVKLSEIRDSIEVDDTEIDPLKLHEDVDLILENADRSLSELKGELQQAGFYDVLRTLSVVTISPDQMIDPADLLEAELGMFREAGLSDSDIELVAKLIVEIEPFEVPNENSSFWRFRIPRRWLWRGIGKLRLPLSKWEVERLTGFIKLIGGAGVIGLNMYFSAALVLAIPTGLVSVLTGLMAASDGFSKIVPGDGPEIRYD